MSKIEFSTCFGIALSLIGVPLGMYFNYLFPIIEWSPIFMMFSIILICSYKNLFLWRFPSYNKIFTLIFVFQLFMLLYGIFSDKLTIQYLSFHLYILSLILALGTIDNRLYYDRVILIAFYVSCICSIFGAFFIWKGLVIGEDAWQLKQDQADYALEPFTIANGAIINYTCVLCLRFKNKILKILVWIFIALDIYILFMSSKRTPVFVAIIISFLFFYSVGKVSKKMLITYIKLGFLFLVGLIITYLYVNVVQKTIDSFSYNFYNGLLNILGNTDVSDSTGSGIERLRNRNWAFNYIDNNFSFFNYILGAGYMTRWIDNPLLQSYLDMGVVGIIIYSYLVVIFPVKSFFKVNNILALFAVLLCVYNILSTYSSGNPYAYIKYVPIVFLAFVLNLKSRNKSYAIVKSKTIL